MNCQNKKKTNTHLILHNSACNVMMRCPDMNCSPIYCYSLFNALCYLLLGEIVKMLL